MNDSRACAALSNRLSAEFVGPDAAILRSAVPLPERPNPTVTVTQENDRVMLLVRFEKDDHQGLAVRYNQRLAQRLAELLCDWMEAQRKLGVVDVMVEIADSIDEGAAHALRVSLQPVVTTL